MELLPTTRVHRNDRAVFRKLTDGTAVLLHLDSGEYHGLSQVGTIIWTLLEHPRTVNELGEEMHRAFNDVPDSVDEDIREFLGALGERDLVVFEPSAATG